MIVTTSKLSMIKNEEIIIADRKYTYSPVLETNDGNCIFLSELNGGRAYNVFCKDITWQHENSYYTTDYPTYPQWIGYDYQEVVNKKGVAIYIDDYFVHLAKDFDIQAEDINGKWITLKSIKNEVWTGRIPNVYWFDKMVRARKFRIYLTASYSGYGISIHRIRFIDGKDCLIYLNETKEVYGMNNGVFTKLADNWSDLTPTEQKTLFLSTNYETATVADLETLGKFKILSYSETEDKPEPILTAVPNDQLSTPKGLINVTAFEGIDNATLTATISGNGSCKLLVTTDLTTYQTYDIAVQEWKEIDHKDLATVTAHGIDAAQLQNIDHAAWDKMITGKTGIGFAYLLSMESVADVGKIDQLNLQVDMKGAWKKAVHGTDYDYEYPANDLLRVSIKTNGDYKINYPEKGS